MYDDYYRYAKRKKRFSYLRSLTVSIILAAILLGGWQTLSKSFTIIGSGQIFGVFTKKAQPINKADLAARIAPLLSKDYLVGIYVYDFKSESDYGFNQDQIFEAASLTKIPVLLTLYSEVQRGNISLSQNITIQADEVQDYGTSVLQYNGSGTKYSLGDLAWYMANRSDNTSFQALSDYFGIQKINNNLHSWGYQNSNIDQNTTTPKEIGGMFSGIYDAKFIHGELDVNMEHLLTNTVDESRIPAGVPAGVTVIHKIGNAIGGLQDAGVVELKDRPYTIAILTRGISDEAAATITIGQISKVVFDYMASLR